MDYNAQELSAEDLERMLVGFCTTGHIGAMGLKHVATGDTWLEYHLPWKEELVGEPGSDRIAPSVLYSLLDTAGALLPFFVQRRMTAYPTLEFRVDHYRLPEPRKDLIIRGESAKLTPDISFVRGVIHEGNPEDPVAIGNGTFMAVRQLKK